MDLESLRRNQHAKVKKSTLWKCKNAFETTNLRRKLQKQLEYDIVSLFETSQFVDLKLESPEGHIYSHKVIVASRFPSCWRLLSAIEKIQFQTLFVKRKPFDILTIWLPSINLEDLKIFIRSLYTNEVNEAFGTALSIYLENHLISLQQNLLASQVLYLEKLNCEETKSVEQILLHQLRKGEISKEKGNLRDVSHLVPPKHTHKKYCCPSKNTLTCDKEGSLISSFYSSHPSRIPVYNRQHSCSGEESCIPYQSSCPSTMSCNSSVISLTEAVNKNRKSCSRKVNCDTGNISQTAYGSQRQKPFFPSSHPNSRSFGNDASRSYENICPAYMGEDPSLCLNSNHLESGAMTSSVIGSEIQKMENLEHELSTESNVPSGSDVSLKPSLMEKPIPEKENGDLDSVQSQSPLQEELASDSDPNGLHETSSLEVELPSSQGDESLSPDSVKPDEFLNDKRKGKETSSENEKNDEVPLAPPPHKPLVRTRTFDLIEPTCSATCVQNDQIDNGDIHQPNQENSTSFSPDPLGLAGDPKPEEEDPATLRELERKKGSLLFEHNIQTFSNIPSTNMMNVGMTSEGGVGVPSLYNSMMENGMRNSIHGTCATSSHTADSSFLSLSLPEMEPFLSSTSTLHRCPEVNPGEIKNVLPQTGSPSPDSLCVDTIPSDKGCEQNSLSKEDFDFEEKEKDEKEISPRSSPERDEFFILSTDSSTLKLNHSETSTSIGGYKEDSKPIVSGGSTLRKDSLKKDKEESHRPQTVRQISSGSVKDVDSIPLVCGYVSPEREKKSSETKVATQQDSQNHQSQSMFSMFINLNEIPSPSKEPAPEPPKHKPQPSGGVFMFIEADKVSSPKTKRKVKHESEQKNVTPAKYSKRQGTDKISSDTGSEEIKTKEKPPKSPKLEKDQKGFFVFIEAENLSKGNSPKPRRRPLHPPKVTKPESNVMSKSAPSDCLRFSKDDSSKSSGTDTSMKLMTKSVIDREEFMAQPYTKRNVSLNDKINESSKIPRPVSNFKEKISLEASKSKKKSHSHYVTNKELSNLKKSKAPVLQGVQSLEASLSETATSMSVSLTESTLPTDVEDVSEFSDVSSLLSSIERSNEPSMEDGKGSHKTLGDDLLKMLVEEINTDVTIQIGEKKIKAHKCILASRCVYFAAMLSGHWVETAGNIIKLQGFSPEAVMMALKHIYSGSSSVPDDVKIGELAALADMLALDGLKEVVAQHLKANLCHYFHKPCSECISGVLEVIPLAGAFCMDELYHKCLKWIAKHYVVVAPTKGFASLPSELRDRVLKQIMDDMSVSNVIETCLGAERVLNLLPVVRWAQPVFDLTAQLLDSSTNFIATNLSGVFMSERFLDLGRDGGWNVDNLGDTLKMACELVRPDQAVLSHIQLTKILDTKQEDCGGDFTESFLSMIARLLKQIEKFIIHNANRVAVCRSWPLLPPETQKRIKDSALVVVEFSKPLGPKPKLSSASKTRSRNSSIEPTQRLRTRSMTDHRLSRSASATVVPAKNVSNFDPKKIQPAGRCHTPPPSTLRVSLHTPPPTRASTLRAQARQASIQRSQSSRTVAERPKGSRTMLHDSVLESDSSSTQGCPRVGSAGGVGYPRARTSSHGSFHTHSTSRSSTPGLPDRPKHHKRNASVSQLLTMNKTLNGEEEPVPKELAEQPISGLTKSPRSISIGTSPLHQHLSSLRENLPCDQRKPPTTCRAKGRVPVGRRLRSPLRENHRVNSPSNYPLAKSESCPPRKGEGPKVPEVLGLGSRSNTFCKDDKPSIASDVMAE